MSSPDSGAPPDQWAEPPEWFEQYFRQHYHDLLRVALVIGGAHHTQEADDAVQSVLVKQVASGCWEHIEKPESYFITAVIRSGAHAAPLPRPPPGTTVDRSDEHRGRP